MSKVLLFLNAAEAQSELLNTQLMSYLDAHSMDFSLLGCKVTIMQTLNPDLFSTVASNGISYSHTLDFDLEKLKTSVDLFAEIHTLIQTLNSTLASESCSVLVGHERDFRPSPAPRFRYHYLMCKKEEFTTADFLDHYSHGHAGFGLATRGINGYAQFYIDKETTQELSRQLNIPYSNYSSVSQMSFADIEQAFTNGNFAFIGPAAIEDEEQFVDRKNSVMMSSTVVKLYQ